MYFRAEKKQNLLYKSNANIFGIYLFSDKNITNNSMLLTESINQNLTQQSTSNSDKNSSYSNNMKLISPTTTINEYNSVSAIRNSIGKLKK